VVVFCSPEYADVQGNLSDSTKATNVTGFRNTDLTNLSSSYVVMDSGWKYQYDRYNDVYRWIPLNADIAGLCARTDFTNDPWFSPAGINRGQIRNVVKLAFNPNKAQRDTLYKAGVNPVISSPGYGTILFGDKTLQIKPSAFDRINVRRLFIVLKKAITAAARGQLFEFNDAFTRAQFRNIVEPYLRDVKGRRGITDFKVVCDETNNTGEVIDRNEFVADIYVKPARSINFISLNFIATKTGIDFSEVTA
jgi:phage tail sheath protein FI